MKLGDILLSRKSKVIGITILTLSIIYLVFRLFIFDYDPIIPFLSSIIDSYLLLIEKCANLLLLWTGSPVTIQNNIISLNGTQLTGFTTMVMYKKAVPFFILLIWITQTSIGKKIYYMILLLAVSFLFLSIDNAVGAHFAGGDPYTVWNYVYIPHSIGYLSMITILFVWYYKNKISILESLAKLPIALKQPEKKIIEVYIILGLYFIVIMCVFNFFEFKHLIYFIFTASKKILALLGYKAVVESHLLVGENGSIYMARYCLGFSTMYLFASIVYLTGYDSIVRWIYIISGVLFLFFVNIMRFVFLFIHIQKHGGYDLAMSVHDMYNYIVYSIVFILWIIWFERFMDIRSFKKR
jgi:exosortase/archaeosortase family protein